MPFIAWGIWEWIIVGGGGYFAYSAGKSLQNAGDQVGKTAGQGLSDAFTIVGIPAGVGIIVYALHKK